jgi:hypothetical protein
MTYPVDPNRMIQMIKQGQNPQQLMLSVLEGQAGTPLTNNLLKLAKNGQTAEIEKIVRNLYAQQGRDFDSEFKAFKNMFGFE